MAAKRPTQESAEVTPTTAGPNDGTAAVADPALAAPDSPAVTAPPAASADAASAPEAAAPAAQAAPPQQVVYVEAPKPFIAKGNRGFGILIAVLSTVIFIVLNAIAQIVFELVNAQPIDVSFITTTGFYAPAIMFLVGFVLLVLVVNRAGWAAHVLGSIFVGLVVFFGGTGLLLLLNISSIPSNQVSEAFTRTLFSPELIIAALIAREVSLWMGAAIASRGHKVKARNVDAKVLYDQEIAAKRAEYEQANAAAGVPGVTPPPAAAAAPAVAETPAAEDTAAPASAE